MKLRWSSVTTLAALLGAVWALPASLVDEIKASELRDNKVKRAQSSMEEHARDTPYFSKPTAIKRGISNLKNPSQEQESLSDWEQTQQAMYPSASEGLANVQSMLFNSDIENGGFDDKTVAEYEKGFNYGTNKEKLDEAMENAVLKSELYRVPMALNQYRYYGNEDKRRRRKRREAHKIRLDTRLKREVNLSPQDILALLTLYESDHQANGYRPWPPQELLDAEQSPDLSGDEDENWMDVPVYPHATGHAGDMVGPAYLLDEPYEKRGRWGGFAPEGAHKRMLPAKRNDPTRELRYLNGPNKNDFYTLSQLLSNQREPDVPLYHRLVL